MNYEELKVQNRTPLLETFPSIPLESNFLSYPYHITVIDEGNGKIQGALVYLKSFADDTVCILAESRTDKDGLSTIRLTKDNYEAIQTRRVMVGAWAQGYEQAIIPVKVGELESGRLTIELKEGLSITGWLVTADGQPLPGVVIRATNDPKFKRSVAFNTYPIMKDDHLLIQAKAGHIRNQATTDNGGWFHIKGLSRGKYFLVADNREYLISPVVECIAPLDDGEFIAVRANCLTVHAFDASEGSRLTSFKVTVNMKSGQNTITRCSARSSGEKFWMAWVPQDLGVDNLVIEILVESDGFENGRVTVEPWFPGEKSIRVELTKIQSRGYPVSFYWANGQPCTDPIKVKIKTAGRLYNQTAVVSPDKNNSYTLMVPDGRWDLEVRPMSVPIPTLVAALTVDSSLGNAPQYIDLPRTGAITTQFSENYLGGWLTVIGSTISLISEIKEKEQVHRLPPGKWQFQCAKPGEETSTQTVEILWGDERMLKF